MQAITNIAVIGAGAWGTALAKLLAEKGLSVRLWAYEEHVAYSINAAHENPVYLEGVPLPASLTATSSFAEALKGCHAILFVVPSHVARAVLQNMRAWLTDPIPLINAAKGLEEGTGKLMTQVMEDVLPPPMHRSLMALSGPSFARELSEGRPTAVCLAGVDDQLVRQFQRILITPTFRVYTDGDAIGVQLGGAMKNVIALAAGIVDGLKLGLNARAALMTRGLAEIVRLGTAMGADPRTFYGLSGVGDLLLTCTGSLSRNHTVGMRLGKGESLDTILQGMHTVAEGVKTARAALELGRRHGVTMPITREINAVLFEHKPCRKAVSDLMERDAKMEKESA